MSTLGELRELSDYQKIILDAAEKAGDILVKYFKQGHHVKTEFKANRHQLLTKADTESQDLIESTLKVSMKAMGHSEDEVGFIGEESLYEPARYTFIIDPIDGTTNFAYGMNHFCISIALYKDSQPFVGCVYAPMYKTVYIAEEGKGAYKMVMSADMFSDDGASMADRAEASGAENEEATNGDRQATSPLVPLHIDHTPLSDSIFLTEPSYRPEEMRQRIKMLDTVQPEVQSIRMLGSAALDFCMLADGQAQIALGGAHMWDFAAVDIIVRQAGGATAQWDGKPYKIDLRDYMQRHHIIASHPDILPRIVELIQA